MDNEFHGERGGTGVSGDYRLCSPPAVFAADSPTLLGGWWGRGVASDLPVALRVTVALPFTPSPIHHVISSAVASRSSQSHGSFARVSTVLVGFISGIDFL